jgi:zinc protease
MQRYLRPDNATVAAILPKRRATAKRAAVFAREAEKRVRRALATPTPSGAPAERRVVLANGAVLLVRRDPSVPVVAMRAVWQGGQRIEDAAHAGASTLVARMITRGCGKLGAGEVADRIDRLGGSLGGVSGRNSFGVAAEWLARSWKPGLDLLADCVIDPQLSAGELAREKRLLLDDQAAQVDSPSQAVFRLFSEALYGAHPYSRDVLGTPASIAALGRADLAAFYRAYYPVSGMTLAIVGDVEVDEVIAQVTARFAKLPRASAPAVAIPSPKFDGRSDEDREVYRFVDRAQAHLVIGFPGAMVNAPDRFALEVLVAVLGGQGGRLFAELRDKRALVYRVSAHSIEGVDPGFAAIYLSCAPDKLDAAVAAINDELDDIRKDGITDAELARAQAYLTGSHHVAMQRRAAVANAMAYHEAYGLGWQSWNRYDDAIHAVTRADVAAAAVAYLRPDRAITATVRPRAASPAATKRSRLPVPARPARPNSQRPTKPLSGSPKRDPVG